MKENRKKQKRHHGKKSKREIQEVAALLKGKYSKTLILSMVVFIMVSMMTSVCFVIVQTNNHQIKHEFTDNINTKIIDVQFNRDMEEDGYLTFGDNEKIHEKLKSFKGKYWLANVYDFGFGMEDSTGGSHFVYGLNKSAQKLFNMDLEEGQGIYVGKENRIKDGVLYVQVPCIDVKKDGLESDKSKIIPLNIKVSKDESGTKYARPEKEGIYVNENTYKEMMAMAFQMGFSSFKERYDSGEEFGIVAIHNIYIHCQSIKDVEAIASKLNSSIYSLSYTLQDFDDLVGSTFKSAKLLLLLSLVAYGIAVVVLIVNIYGHFRNMIKDMGILRHLGFSIKEVERIYGKTIEKVMLFMGGFDGILSFAVSKIFAAEIWLKTAIITCFMLLVSLVLVYIVVYILLCKISEKNILTLLRFSKESE